MAFTNKIFSFFSPSFSLSLPLSVTLLSNHSTRLLSTTHFLCKRLPPKPHLPGFHHRREEMVYKQYKQFDYIFRKEGETRLIWEDYVRRHSGQIPPQRTRLRCKRNIKKPVVSNPCPICRDNIDIQHTDVNLLKQFIDPHTGNVIRAVVTGVCRLQQKKLEAAIEKAKDYGTLTYTVPRPPPPTEKIAPPTPVWNKFTLLDNKKY